MEAVGIHPQPGPQTQFLKCQADILIYGGAAGGSKTYALLMDPLRYIDNSIFGAVIFRRAYPQIIVEGGMWDESMLMYPSMGGLPSKSTLTWTFPKGSNITFAHLGPGEELKWQGAQVAAIGFDQLEHWPEGQFFYMLSRNRSMCGIKPYIRATCNPDADNWIAKFIAWWIDQETGYPLYERAGVLRWFVRVRGELEWFGSVRELRAKYPDKTKYIPKSVTFIPASVYDNKILLEKNPDYLANLLALPPVEQERLLKGNWKIKQTAGKIFDKSWFEIVGAIPPGGLLCRFWDFASTAKKLKKNDPDFTAGVLERKTRGTFFIEDCIAEQIGVGGIDQLFLNTTKQDVALAHETGAHYMVRWEVEPGSAGRREAFRLIKLLGGMGIDSAGVPAQGDKYLRSKPLAQQAQIGNIKVLEAPWTSGWLNHMHNQPEIAHDDIHDASAGAYNALTVGMRGEGDDAGADESPAAGSSRYAGGSSTRRQGSLRGRL